MSKKKLIVFLYFSVVFSKTAQSNELRKEDQQNTALNLKKNFSREVRSIMQEFSSFLKKFDVPYLGVVNAVHFAREIAKAISFSPFVLGKESFEDYVMEQIIKLVLPGSSNYCPDIQCIASSMADIMADVSIDSGFISKDATEKAIKMHANYLAGNVLLRIRRLPNQNSEVSSALENIPMNVSSRYIEFIKLLVTGIYNTTVSHFCLTSGLEISKSTLFSSAVCGSSFLCFRIDLIPEMSRSMTNMHEIAKAAYTPRMNSSIDSMVISSIIAETISLKMLEQGYFNKINEISSISETCQDLLKLMMVGINRSKMKIHGDNYK